MAFKDAFENVKKKAGKKGKGGNAKPSGGCKGK